MKSLKYSVLAALFAVAFVFTSCGNHSHDQAGDQTDQEGKEYTSAYICPMHCEGSGSDEAGKCPVCGMDYVANKDQEEVHQEDSHNHDHDHDHDH